jgi:hypothetical protein
VHKIRRRYPRARPDLRFQPEAGGLTLHDAHGVRANPLSFTAALVLTYCDGQHPPELIAESVAGLAGSRSDAEQLRADVQRIIHDFAEAGLVH